MGERDDLEAALARVTGLEEEIERLHAENTALEATLARDLADAEREASSLTASPALPGAATHGDAYRDELAAVLTRAHTLDEQLVELRRANTALTALVAADAEAREKRERARRIEAADQRESEAATALAHREQDRLARREERGRPAAGPIAIAAGVIFGGAIGFAVAPAAGAIVGVIALLCTLALLMAR